MFKTITRPFEMVQHRFRPAKTSASDLVAARETDEYRECYEVEEPLVSICVATYNRSDLLIDRCVASLLAQTYRNIEVIVVGDCCTDDSFERLSKIDDPRLKYENLPQRAAYDDALVWNIAGLVPTNRAWDLATGHFITRLDDDDAYTPDRVEKLVGFAKKTKAEFIYHPFDAQDQDDSWYVNKARPFHRGFITSGSMFFHRWLGKNVRMDAEFILYNSEPGDWNFARQCRKIGARIARHPDVLLTHYKERTQAP